VRTVEKACACVVRGGAGADGGLELLVLDHPEAGTQLPKGTLLDGEQPVAGVLRELAEETGLTDVEVDAVLGTWARVTGAGPRGRGGPERHLWHVVLLASTGPAADTWRHAMVGSPEEERLVVTCRWVPLDGTVWMRLHPLFTPVLDMVLAAVRRRS
jgi:8-oxo-dGTP pyrophosphatase MutT (NUDIX family)